MSETDIHDITEHRGPTIIPTPNVMHESNGRALRLNHVGIAQQYESSRAGDVVMRQLQDELRRRGVTSYAIVGDATSEDRSSATIALRLDDGLAAQEYTLDIDERGVVIRGGDLAGVRYGVQTLRQIIRQTAPVLPALHIEDRPATPMRGYYLDVSRGRVPTLDWLKHWADELCLYKYNQLQLYIEHAFAFRGMSEAWRGASPLTADDITAFDAYCWERGIELVPSVSTFGHLYMALRTNALRELGEFPDTAGRPFSFVERMHHHTLNVTLDESFAFSKRLIDEYMPLFRSRRFNICADETFDLGKGRSHETAERLGVSALYVRYVNRLCAYVSSRGREPMLWGDIAIEMPEVLPQLPSDAILLNWQYDPDCTDEKVRLVADRGVRQVVCPAAHAWNRLLPFVEPTWRNIARLARYGRESHAEGFLLTDWGDYGHVNDPRMSVPALVMGGQCAWSARDLPFEAMAAMIARLEYGDRSGGFVAAAERASAQTAAVWEDIVRFVEVEEPDGSVNADVVNSVWWIDADRRAEVCRRGDLREARRIVMQPVAEHVAALREGASDADDVNDARGVDGTDGSCDVRDDGAARGSDALRIMQDACCAAYDGAVVPHDDVAAWLLAAQGQDLMNDVGLALAIDAGALRAEDVSGDMPSPDALADKLESWFEQYCDQWREVSRESELRRIAAVLWKACDYLRALRH